MNAVVLSIIALVLLLIVGVPFWVAMGLGTVAMLASTQALPLTLVGEALFEGDERAIREARSAIGAAASELVASVSPGVGVVIEGA